MCNSKVEKEEVFINQNAAGNNQADIKDIGWHLGELNIVTYVILAITLIVVAFFAFRLYRSCHREWIREEFRLQAMTQIRNSLRGLRNTENTNV